MICVCCSKEQVRIPSNYISKSGTKTYVNRDDRGRFWNGRTCPDCYNIKQRENNKKATKGGRQNRSKPTTRMCRTCKKPLPESRYFNHEVCASFRENNYMNWDEVCGVIGT